MPPTHPTTTTTIPADLRALRPGPRAWFTWRRWLQAYLEAHPEAPDGEVEAALAAWPDALRTASPRDLAEPWSRFARHLRFEEALPGPRATPLGTASSGHRPRWITATRWRADPGERWAELDTLRLVDAPAAGRWRAAIGRALLRLDLIRCDLDIDGLAEALAGVPMARLEHLELVGNPADMAVRRRLSFARLFGRAPGLGDGDDEVQLRPWLAGLRDRAPTLRVLRFAEQRLHAVDLHALAEALGDRLHDLALDEVGIDRDDLAAVVRRMPNLRRLSLAGARLGAEGLRHLADARWWPTLDGLALDRTGLASAELRSGQALAGGALPAVAAPSLRALSVAENGLGPDDAVALLAWLGEGAEHLDLRGNPIFPGAGSALIDVARSHAATLRHLDLRATGLDATLLRRLAGLQLPALHTLRIAGNLLGPQAADALLGSTWFAGLEFCDAGPGEVGWDGVRTWVRGGVLRADTARDPDALGALADAAWQQQLATSPGAAADLAAAAPPLPKRVPEARPIVVPGWDPRRHVARHGADRFGFCGEPELGFAWLELDDDFLALRRALCRWAGATGIGDSTQPGAPPDPRRDDDRDASLGLPGPWWVLGLAGDVDVRTPTVDGLDRADAGRRDGLPVRIRALWLPGRALAILDPDHPDGAVYAGEHRPWAAPWPEPLAAPVAPPAPWPTYARTRVARDALAERQGLDLAAASPWVASDGATGEVQAPPSARWSLRHPVEDEVVLAFDARGTALALAARGEQRVCLLPLQTRGALDAEGRAGDAVWAELSFPVTHFFSDDWRIEARGEGRAATLDLRRLRLEASPDGASPPTPSEPPAPRAVEADHRVEASAVDTLRRWQVVCSRARGEDTLHLAWRRFRHNGETTPVEHLRAVTIPRAPTATTDPPQLALSAGADWAVVVWGGRCIALDRAERQPPRWLGLDGDLSRVRGARFSAGVQRDRWLAVVTRDEVFVVDFGEALADAPALFALPSADAVPLPGLRFAAQPNTTEASGGLYRLDDGRLHLAIAADAGSPIAATPDGSLALASVGEHLVAASPSAGTTVLPSPDAPLEGPITAAAVDRLGDRLAGASGFGMTIWVRRAGAWAANAWPIGSGTPGEAALGDPPVRIALGDARSAAWARGASLHWRGLLAGRPGEVGGEVPDAPAAPLLERPREVVAVWTGERGLRALTRDRRVVELGTDRAQTRARLPTVAVAAVDDPDLVAALTAVPALWGLVEGAGDLAQVAAEVGIPLAALEAQVAEMARVKANALVPRVAAFDAAGDRLAASWGKHLAIYARVEAGATPVSWRAEAVWPLPGAARALAWAADAVAVAVGAELVRFDLG